MKILFIGDYSNLHATLAVHLKSLGHQVCVVSDKGDYINSDTDIYLKREPGFGGGFRYLYKLFNLLPSLRDFDVVQFINPNFLSLKPGKIKYFFDHLRNQNGKTFLTMAGNDYYFCKACLDGKLFRFSEFKVGDKFTDFHNADPKHLYGWINYANRHWNEYFYDKIDGAMSVLPEYDMVAREIIPHKTVFTNIPINLCSLPLTQDDLCFNPIKIFIGMRSGMELQKGADKLLKLAKEIEKELPGKVIVEKVSDLPLNEFLKKMNSSHIVLDQLYSYSPATTALFAMAMGKAVGTGAQPEYYSYLENQDAKPVICLSPFENDIKDKIINLIENREELQSIGRQSRELVEKHNDVKIVADKFLKHWQT